MRVSSRFKLEPVDEPGKSRLVVDGHPTPTLVTGIDLEAQFDCRAGSLLLLTQDSPYEESLHMLLVAPGAKTAQQIPIEILDELILGGAYTPGILTEVAVAGENSLEFSFFGKDRWRVTAHANPRPAISGALTSMGKRPLGYALRKRYLELESLVS